MVLCKREGEGRTIDFFVPLRDCSLCWDHLEVVQTPTLDTALLSSSRVGTDLGRMSGSEDDASPVDTDENPSLQIPGRSSLGVSPPWLYTSPVSLLASSFCK